MSPVILWLFFTLDRIIGVFGLLMVLSITYLGLIILICIIGGFCVQDSAYSAVFSPEKYWGFCKGVGNRIKKYNIIAIVFLCLGICVITFMPNTKEAVAIVVIPKVLDYAKSNKEMMKIPDNVLKMANSFMEKKIKDWTVSLGDSSCTKENVPIDSQISRVSMKLEELKKLKDKAVQTIK